MKRFCVATGLGAALLLVPAAPAAAASGITSPGAGETVVADAVVPLRALVEGPVTGPSELTLRGPDAAEGEVVAVQTSPAGGELAYDFDTACATRLCTGRVPALNGTWTVELRGAAEDERSFVLRIPPAAPVDVAAVPSEGGVRVMWRQGDEPDLTGYAVQDERGGNVRDGIALEACDAERQCSVEVPQDAGAWTVRAFRSVCPGCGEVLASESSATVRAAAPPPLVPASPPAAPSTGPPPPSAKSAAARPGAQRDAFTRAFGTGRRPLTAGAPAPPAAQPAAPLPDGTFDPTLGYAEQERVLSTAPAPAPRGAPESVASLATADRLRLGLLAAVMVAAAVWLRRWARRAIRDDG